MAASVNRTVELARVPVSAYGEDGVGGEGCGLGDENDPVGRLSGAHPGLLDLGEGHGSRADVEGAFGDCFGDCFGELRDLLDEVAAGNRADPAADDLEPGRTQRGGGDRSFGPATEPISIQVRGGCGRGGR
jgi:hypothetical protein